MMRDSILLLVLMTLLSTSSVVLSLMPYADHEPMPVYTNLIGPVISNSSLSFIYQPEGPELEYIGRGPSEQLNNDGRQL